MPYRIRTLLYSCVIHCLIHGPYTGGGGGGGVQPFQINDIQLAHKHPFIEIFNAHLHFSNHF